MNKLMTFNEFLNEDSSVDTSKQAIADLKSKVAPPQDAHDPGFDVDNLKNTIEDDQEKIKDDLETTKNKISRKDALSIKQDDHVFHKHRQSLGIGIVNKLHPDKKHAIVHFTNGLQSSLVDEKGKHSHDEHKMALDHLVAVAATES